MILVAHESKGLSPLNSSVRKIVSDHLELKNSGC